METVLFKRLPFALLSIDAYHKLTDVGIIVLMVSVCALSLLLLRTYHKLNMSFHNQYLMEKIAYSDPLTGKRNYAKFLLDVQRLLQKSTKKKYAVWSYDIKGFQRVNALFGIDLGDTVLKRVSAVFEGFEDPESVFCRASADRFVGIRSYERKQDLVNWFLSFVSQLDDRKILSKRQMPSDYAIGFYCLNDFEDQPTISDMVNYATIAKKFSKSRPGNQHCFFSLEMHQQVRRETMLLGEIESALSQGDIIFLVQPKVSIQNEFHVIGGEVLVRWNHPSWGRIPPCEFIPLFENNGFITKLDRYVFEQSCAWYAKCLTQGIAPFQLAINVSRLGFLQDDFVEYYSSVKQAYNISDSVLELEITESVPLEDYELFRSLIEDLHRYGFICSLDDFGSGHSSLNVLKNLPIDILKLDAVLFQANNEVRRRANLVVSGLTTMAQNLCIKTVAEGIESSDQVEFLQKVGCNVIQGYIFSEPLLIDDFVCLLTNNNRNIEIRK